MNENYLIWGIGLLVAALLLLVVEALVPSAGIIGLVAASIAIAGIVCLFNVSVMWGIVGIITFIGVGGVGFLFALSIMPNTRFGRRLILGEDADKMDDEEGPPPDALDHSAFAHLIGKEGVAATDMRPIGAIRIGAERYQASSETAYVRTGTPVRVTSADDHQIKVRPIE